MAHENGHFSNGPEITTEGAQSLRMMKMQNAELYLKEATVIYGFYLLAARLVGLTSKLERLDISVSLVQLRAKEQAFN